MPLTLTTTKFEDAMLQRLIETDPLRDLISFNGRPASRYFISGPPDQRPPYFSCNQPNNMKIVSTKEYTQAQLESAVASAVAAGANCAKVLPIGRTRSSIIGLEKLTSFLGHDVTVEFGSRKALGLPFASLDKPALPEGEQVAEIKPRILPAGVEVVPPAKKTASPRGDFKHKVNVVKKVAKVRAPRPAKGASRVHSGFVALIDKLLHEGVGRSEVQGYRRSKHTVNAAVAIIMKAFPDKKVDSVKKIVKVRPRSIVKRSAPGTLVPRWAWVGPGYGDGVMERVDELILGGKLTARQICDAVSAEFGKDPATFIKTVEARVTAKENKAEKKLVVKVRPNVPPAVRRAKVNRAKTANQTKRAAEKARVEQKRRASNAKA